MRRYVYLILLVAALTFGWFLMPTYNYFVTTDEQQTDEESPYDDVLPEKTIPEDVEVVPTFKSIGILKDVYTDEKDLINFIYNYDKKDLLSSNEIRIDEFLNKSFKTDLSDPNPKILIFHTHASETYVDSAPGEVDDTIVGVGRRLADILVKDYGVCVVHDTACYDIDNGMEDRKNSYIKMEPAVKKMLEKYPTIEVVIDLHRDGVPDNLRLVKDINGKPTAQIMFFNGIYKNHENPYLLDNLALSLHMQLTANELYPGLARKLYVKPNNYSHHFMPKSLLIEAGANTNTVEEAKNAMEPLAKILYTVLTMGQ